VAKAVSARRLVASLPRDATEVVEGDDLRPRFSKRGADESHQDGIERSVSDDAGLFYEIEQSEFLDEIGQIYEELKAKESRCSFWAFRQYISEQLIKGWWQRLVANELMDFYVALKRGERPKLVIMAPPQHGKTKQVIDFLAWVAGLDPHLKSIYASYSSDLGEIANLTMQRIIDSPQYKRVFPGTRLARPGRTDGLWQRNLSLFEIVGESGCFRNTTVQGQITGQGLDIGVVDDPVKGRADVMQKSSRDKTWAWFTDDFFSRFSEKAGMIFIMTRWHVDDPVGRLIERMPNVKVLRFPAIDETDPRRAAGGALFPEFKSLEFLLERKKLQTQAGWESEYQQNPIITGGGIYPIDKIQVLTRIDPGMVKRSVRYFDKAGTHGGGDYTAGVLMHGLKDGSYVIAHVTRGQWAARQREDMIKFWANADKKLIKTPYEVVIEQEPGSSGKDSVEATIRNLAGFSVHADKVTGSKEIRAEPLAAQVQGGNVALLAGAWNVDLLDEMETFPSGRYRDQCDAASGAFNRLAGGPRYSIDSGWLD
jgi:predicted phage terminase large subunit-like protein